MMRRLACLGIFAAWVACYDEPKPACGFRCGPAQECPDGYTCADDGRCHRTGSDPTLVCGSIDAAIPDSPDGPEIFDALPDAPSDALTDAPIADGPPPDA